MGSMAASVFSTCLNLSGKGCSLGDAGYLTTRTRGGIRIRISQQRIVIAQVRGQLYEIQPEGFGHLETGESETER